MTLTVRPSLEKENPLNQRERDQKQKISATTGERELSSARRAYKCQTFSLRIENSLETGDMEKKKTVNMQSAKMFGCFII